MHEGHRNRLRNRYLSEGLDSFEPHEILELLLYYAIPRRDTNAVAHRLVDNFGSLSAVFEARVSDLVKKGDISENTAMLINMVPHLSRRYLHDRWGERPTIADSKVAGEYAKSIVSGRTYEVFYLLCMDKQHRITRPELICEGTIDETPAYPRLIVEAAIRHKAQCVILVHNHPGGSLHPSAADIEVTKKLVTVLNAIDINVMDHIIVAGDQYLSLADRGLMDF